METGPGTGIQERKIREHSVLVNGNKANISAEVPEQQDREYSFDEEKIYTNPSQLLKQDRVIPSFSLIRFSKVKNFIEGVYAAVEERVMEKGLGLSRTELLKSLETRVDNEAREYVRYAIDGETRGEPSMSIVQGFYDWSRDLRKAYRQIKILARVPGFFFDRENDADFNKKLLGNLKQAIYDSGQGNRYDSLLEFYSKMTNKNKEKQCLFPSAQLPDQEYFKVHSFEREGDDLPEGLGKVLVQAIKDGKINFIPDDNSGLYIWQMNEIIPLVRKDTPEFSKFLVNKKYSEILENEFISQWAGTRHTHVGHSDFDDVMMASIDFRQESPIAIQPKLEVEPFSSSYMKMLKSLGFLEDVIERYMPEVLERKRLISEGKRSSGSIRDEFVDMRKLLGGLAMISEDSIHLKYDADGLYPREGREMAREWLSNISLDEDINRNNAIFVPIIRTADGRRQVCYINAGFKLIDVETRYKNFPIVSVNGNPYFSGGIEFMPQNLKIPVLVHREVRVPYEKLINDRKLREMLKSEFSEKELDETIKEIEAS
jgi:hypothetical protein